MISIIIKTNRNKVFDSYDEDIPTLTEVGLALHRLAEMKAILMKKQFKSDLEISEGDFIEGEDQP